MDPDEHACLVLEPQRAGAAVPALQPDMEGLCREEPGPGLEGTLAGPWPEGLKAALDNARSAFPGLLSSRDGDVLSLEPPEGHAWDAMCAACGCGHFVYKMRKGDCRVYCLVCGWYCGHVPLRKKAWQWTGESKIWKGARSFEGTPHAYGDAHPAASLQACGTLAQPCASARPAALRQASREAPMPPAAALSISFTRTAPEDWPAPWQKLRARVKRGWLCWTYWELGQDLCRGADPERLRVLAQIVASLHRPAGTNTFWPCTLAALTDGEQGRTAFRRDLFWSGVRELGERMVVSMGDQASIAIGLPKEAVQPLHWDIRNGVILCTVWDFVRIAEQPSRLDDVVVFLNNMFRLLRL